MRRSCGKYQRKSIEGCRVGERVEVTMTRRREKGKTQHKQQRIQKQQVQARGGDTQRGACWDTN